jgi:hypothetical protein
VQALFSDTTGAHNTASGVNALYHNTTGSTNTAVGASAGNNLTTGSNNVDISNAGLAAEAGKIRIGTKGTQTAAFLAGVSGVTIPGPTKTVVVNSNGQLGTAPAGTAPPVHISPGTSDDRALRRQVARLTAQLRTQAAQLRKLSDLVHSRQ